MLLHGFADSADTWRLVLDKLARRDRVDDLADGHLVLADHEIDLAGLEVPVLAVAGETDVLAPRPTVHHLGDLLPNAPEVRLETTPGGRLGELTGRAARHSTWRHLDQFLDDRPAAADAEPLAPAA